MDGPKKTPVLFANKVIRQLVDQFVDGDVAVLPDDYTKLRVAFRKLGGSWEAVVLGDIEETRRLLTIVKKWGKARKEESYEDRLI